MSVNESQTNVVYKVDDCIGPLVDVKKWLDNLESEVELILRAECRWMWRGGACVCMFVFVFVFVFERGTT